MFLNGKTYDIKRAPHAMQTAAARWLKVVTGGESGASEPLEQYDAMLEASHSLVFLRWMCKHLIPGLPVTEISDESAPTILRAIELRHKDPDKEAALTIMRQRQWESENGNSGTDN